MKILKIDELNFDSVVSEAVRVLDQGGLIIYPTETAYGIGVNIENHEAIVKLLAYKGDRKSPIAIATSGVQMAEKYANLSETALKLYEKYLPGPLTVISNSNESVDKLLTNNTGTIGVRVPDHKLVLSIVTKLGAPITATSANISGGKTPYSLEEYLENTSKEKTDLIDLFIDAGKLSGELPSTVIKAVGDKLEIVRQGKITPEI